MECKVYNHFFISPVNICINRNIVECKASSTIVSSPLRLHVLIETLWNVKQGMENRRKEMNLVLIETLWNVKSVDHLQVDFSLRINRNIVECKVGIALTCLECSG